ncbi:2-hydroxyacyl-CoA lyase 2-like [Hydractinia symbiolongicarpus]|uniref:2-hydroxyacyl-CoA lyase 2-like n=1 Tax=Hydractinia symbiolongicarpus TaxID=13093 RepID=UPI00254E891C|nr:2-hydroxyacyl-CoA lyase 2-like [Hydractinia symbiolongicarpus]
MAIPVMEAVLFVLFVLIISAFIIVYKFKLFYTLTKKVDRSSKRHGGELVAQVLKSHGVKYIFTLCGGHISPILVASEDLGIKIIDTRHEVNAVFAADAVARLSGTVGVAAVTAGPGLTNTVTAIKNAQMAESPVLLIGGAAVTLLKGRGALQDIDQMCLFKPLCKFTATVSRVAEIIPTLQKALQVAQSGTPGPVFVEFPIDVLYPYQLVHREAGIKESPNGFMPKIVNWYISNNVNAIFAGAWDVVSTKPLRPQLPMPSNEDVTKAWNLLKFAKKPVALLGSQSTLPPIPVNNLREALEGLGIPCFLGGMSRGLLGRNSALHIRQRRRDALAEADLVLLIGTVCDFRLSYGRVLNKKSKIIAVNRNREQLYKNSDIFWKPTIACLADPATFVCELHKAKNMTPDWTDWAQILKEREIAKEQANKMKADGETGSLINPVKLLHELENALDDNSIIVADGGDFVGTAAYILRPRGPLCWLDPGAFGTLGVGGGFALGAKLVRPEAEVWIIWGDGSSAYSIAEYDTYKRFKVPVIGLIGNDACWSQIAREQVPLFDSSVGCDLLHTDYDKVVEGYGGVGLKIDNSDVKTVYETFQKAKEYAASGKPVVINALIGKSDFRAGSISV